jgi:hypothetical protein
MMSSISGWRDLHMNSDGFWSSGLLQAGIVILAVLAAVLAALFVPI